MQIMLTAPQGIDMALVLGSSDTLLHLIEDAVCARITVRGNGVSLEGNSTEVHLLRDLFCDLFYMIQQGNELTEDYVRRSIKLLRSADFLPQVPREDILVTHRGHAIRPKTLGQKHYVDAICAHPITFGIGPAGTGKTYLAMACAIAALKRKDVAHIILSRPTVEAGEHLGFLPGTLTEKVDPYIRPLYDALFDMMNRDYAYQLIEGNVIEIAPLAFMRGRTFNDSFIILDEAQGTSPDQMKMFLTRLGFGSKMVITGDLTQVDIAHARTGLKSAYDILTGVEGIHFSTLSGKDIVRHSLVGAIVAAYDRAAQQKG